MESPNKSRAVTRRFMLAGGAASAALVAGCSHMPRWMGGKKKAVPQPVPQGGAQLKKVLDALAVAWLRESPETATNLGVSEAQAGGSYLGRLSDYSAAGMQRGAAIAKSTLGALAQIDTKGLSAQDAISLDVVQVALSTRLAGSRFPWGRSGLSEPTPYIVTQIDGGYINVPSFLDAQHPLRNASDVDAYLSRLEAFATVLDQESMNIAGDASRGTVPPDFTVDGALAQLRGLAAKKPGESMLVLSLKNRIGKAEGVDADHAAKALKDAAAIVGEKVVPAMHRQIDALAKIRPQAVHEAGVWRLKGGDEFYLVGLRAFTTSNKSPDEIHQLGLDLLKDISAQMEEILKGHGLTKGSLAARVQQVSKEKKQLYPNTDAGREQLLKDLNAQIAGLQPYLRDNFGILAKTPLEIKRVPPFKQAGSPGGYYESGSLDGTRPGYYYINLRDTAEWPKFSLPTLTYHEGEPGHHWQISIQQENATLPFVRSALLGFSGYAEGWGLYSEQLADEMGVYKDDPLGRLGYLQSAAFRAARLVADTGLHSKHWSREKAIDFMVEALGRKRTAIATEVERYAVWPGQACAYMLGREIIRGLREDAKAKLGSKFDIKAFHDVVLKNGSVPLSTLGTIVNAWVAEVNGPPKA